MLAVAPLSWATPAWGLVLPWPSGNSWEAAIKLLLRNWSGNLKDRTIHPLGTLLTHWSPGTRLPTLYVSPVNVYLFKTYSSPPIYPPTEHGPAPLLLVKWSIHTQLASRPIICPSLALLCVCNELCTPPQGAHCTVPTRRRCNKSSFHLDLVSMQPFFFPW